MVRNPKKVLGSRKYRNFSNEQLVKAVETVRSGLSLRKAEEQFGLPRCSINRAIRGKNTGKRERDRKQTNKKLNVPAGRGICENDIVILEDNPKQEKKKRKQLVEDQTVINEGKLSKEGRQKTRKVLESSESDEDSCNEVVFDDSSDDDWDSFRAKQIMNIEDHIEDNIDDNIEDNNQESIYSHPTLQPINKQVGSFVIVRYDSNFYPGVIEKLDDKGATISAMTKTLRENWKWPEHKD
ncbi:hypothetical protein JTB14_020477 [Gonioctena quinquepunctata]|nr:hypothetical protein JTB14_020477 [Gonioctena quinquepunctata]